MIISPVTLLTQDQVERIHQTSLEILEDVGLLVHHQEASEIFVNHGCLVNTETNTVRLPRSVIEHFRASIPPKFTFYARDPNFDRTIPDDAPVIVTASSAPNIIDPVTGENRRARSDDIARIAHLVNQLDGYDVFSISTLAEDASADQLTLARLYPSAKNCLKPLRISGPAADAETILRFATLVAGGEEAYREHPFITHHYCPVVSPLTMDVDSTENLLFFTEQKLPCHPSIVPNAGLTSPLTLTATLAQGNAEFLAAAVLEQMVDQGKATIYSTLPTVADIRTGAYAPGAIETGILHIGFAQIAHFYNIPCGGYVGLTNSKVCDAQSGYETSMSCVAALLGGVHIFNMAGLLDALMSFDFAKAVIDDEIALMLKRLMRGIEFSEEELALNIIAEVGPGGTFIDHMHTLEHMRTTALLPKIADREPHLQWQERGSLDTHAHAMLRAREILTAPNDAVFSEDVDARLRDEFKNLVAGDSLPPRGWESELT